jgi:hypothetical protein
MAERGGRTLRTSQARAAEHFKYSPELLLRQRQTVADPRTLEEHEGKAAHDSGSVAASPISLSPRSRKGILRTYHPSHPYHYEAPPQQSSSSPTGGAFTYLDRLRELRVNTAWAAGEPLTYLDRLVRLRERRGTMDLERGNKDPKQSVVGLFMLSEMVQSQTATVRSYVFLSERRVDISRRHGFVIVVICYRHIDAPALHL